MLSFTKWIFCLILISPLAYAVEGDLSMPDTRFQGDFNRLVCNDLEGAAIEAPIVFSTRNVQIEKILVDRMALNFIINGYFEQDSTKCRYSSRYSRGARSSMKLEESAAFAVDGTSDCQLGRSELDALFTTPLTFNYTGSPIHWVGIKVKTKSAVEICGPESTGFRMVFERGENIPVP